MRLLRLAHRWIGIALAIPILLVAISGGLLLFRDPYYRVAYPSVGRPIAAAEEAGYASILELIDERFRPPGITVVKFPRRGLNAFHVYLSDRSEALMHPRTGAVIARWRSSSSVPAFLFDLHAHLLAGDTGETLNGAIALLLTVLSATGLVLWWPRRASAFHPRAIVLRRATSAALLRAHAASGSLLLLPVLLFAATGAGLVFYTPASRLAARWLDATPVVEPSAHRQPSNTGRRAWSELLEAARRTFPDAGPTMVYPGTRQNAVVTFRKRLPGEWHPNGRTYVLIDPYTAAVVQQIDARAQGTGTRIMHALYPVHAAKVGGSGMTALALTAALGLVWLAFGASWAWLGRLLARFSRRGQRTHADSAQRARANCRDRGPALHTHEPGSLSAAFHPGDRASGHPGDLRRSDGLRPR